MIHLYYPFLQLFICFIKCLCTPLPSTYLTFCHLLLRNFRLLFLILILILSSTSSSQSSLTSPLCFYVFSPLPISLFFLLLCWSYTLPSCRAKQNTKEAIDDKISLVDNAAGLGSSSGIGTATICEVNPPR